MGFEIVIVLGLLGAGYFYLISGGTASPDMDTSGNGTLQAPTPTGDSDNVAAPGWAMAAHVAITYDPVTWPSGDRIWSIARAIALQEGANKSNSAPDRNNNPGDISDGSSVYGFDPVVKDSKVTRFPSKDVGWKWLYEKISNAAYGRSSVYSPDMTWIQIGSHWASDPNWPYGVAGFLGVSPDSTLRQYTGT